MKNTTTAEMMEALKSMTAEERIAYLKANRPDLFQVKAPVSINRPSIFNKVPQGGWTDEDRIG